MDIREGMNLPCMGNCESFRDENRKAKLENNSDSGAEPREREN
jgi:hypothetical protein